MALEVGELDDALALYARLFDFELRGRVPGMAFIDMGDQFLAISEGRRQPPDVDRHFGLVVDDKRAVEDSAREAGLEVLQGRGVHFRDPWGNLFEIVEYGDVQFERTPGVKRRLGIGHLTKTEAAVREIDEKGLA